MREPRLVVPMHPGARSGTTARRISAFRAGMTEWSSLQKLSCDPVTLSLRGPLLTAEGGSNSWRSGKEVSVGGPKSGPERSALGCKVVQNSANLVTVRLAAACLERPGSSPAGDLDVH